MKIEFSRRQWRIFLGCFLAYTSAYITRLNLPAALSSLMSDVGLTGTQGGLLQTMFALVYACGQFVNGAVVDRISARRHIVTGLVLSGICNLFFASATQYWMLASLWVLNGAAQSMIWTPVVKMMATWFKGRRRSQVSFGMVLALIAGNLFAWAISGFMASAVSWRWSFAIPAVWTMIAAGLSRVILIDQPEPGEELGEERDIQKASGTSGTMPFGTMLLSTGLIPLLICCIGNGFVRDGIITWAPTIIVRLNSAASVNPTLISLMIPLLNLIGVLMAGKTYSRFRGNARRTVSCLMVLSAVLAILLIPSLRSVFACALLLGLCCSAAYGINPMLTTFIPMEYERAGRVGVVAGMMDAFIYVGSALAGVVTGAVSDAAGWKPVFAIWCAAAILAGAAGWISLRGLRKLD